MYSRNKVLKLLKSVNPLELDILWKEADRVRSENVGPGIHFRGLIEISNHCRRSCLYCGLRGPNKALKRYRMTSGEILECATAAHRLGYGTVVMQAGEDEGIERNWLSEVISQIKEETPLAVTLSLGERTLDELAAWKKAGADRYFLRFETSDPLLYSRIHPGHGDTASNRIELLKHIMEIGYETGSGIMVGIPGQTYESLADDLFLFSSMDLDMVGIGPFIPHPGTPLGKKRTVPSGSQVPNTVEMASKVVALCRLLCPQVNLPSTTALASLAPDGHVPGLTRGANVVMPALTPVRYRKLYEIYPGRTLLSSSPLPAKVIIEKLGLEHSRTVSQGVGKRAKVRITDLPRMA